MRILKRIWCGLFVGHSHYWRCEENYGVKAGWNLMAVGTCVRCGHKTEMKKVVGK